MNRFYLAVFLLLNAIYLSTYLPIYVQLFTVAFYLILFMFSIIIIWHFYFVSVFCVVWLCGAAILYNTVVFLHVATACCISHAVL